MRDFGALRGRIGVVQFLDFLCDGQNRFASRHDLVAQKTRAAKNLLGCRPVEQRLERPPVSVQLRLEIVDALGMRGVEHPQLRDGRPVGLAELREALTVFDGVLARDVEQIVTHENAGQIDVGSKPPQLDVDLVMVGIELIELAVDFLGLARRRQHRHDNQHEETSKTERRDRPRLEPHRESS